MLSSRIRLIVPLMSLTVICGQALAFGEGYLPPRGFIGKPVVTGPVIGNTVDVSSGEEVIYRTFFDRSNMTGDIIAEPVKTNVSPQSNTSETNPYLTPTDRLLIAIGVRTEADFLRPSDRGKLARWMSPAGRLFLKDFSERNIFTRSGGRGVPFRYEDLTSSDRGRIGSKDLINYVRGERKNEHPLGRRYRERTGLLGEIVHSNLYMWTHQSAGLDREDPSSGPPQRLYVNANDGMMHVFDAKTGEEVYAYVPSQIFGRLRKYAEKDGVFELQDEFLPTEAVLDGQITIARVDLRHVGKGFRTILVSTLGAGGKGLFALDVTDPYIRNLTADARKKVMWEVGDSGAFKDSMGYIHGAPVLASLSDGRKVVITGNGYFNDNDRASLFVIDLVTGSLIKEFRLPNSRHHFVSAFRQVGLATPSLVLNSLTGAAEVAYAGDSLGRLWKFDLTNLNSSPKQLFQTEVVQSRAIDGFRGQPITTAPVIQRLKNGNHAVVFGTGMLLRPVDITRFLYNRIYGIIDDGNATSDNELAIREYRDVWRLGELRRDYRIIRRRLLFNGRDNGKGWSLDLGFGERVLGHLPLGAKNQLHVVTDRWLKDSESYYWVLDAEDGGPPTCPVFDLNRNGQFCPGGNADVHDLAAANVVQNLFNNLFEALNLRDRTPVAHALGGGIFSQPVLLSNQTRDRLVPIYNWNSGRSAWNYFDPNKFQILDPVRDAFTRNRRFSVSVNSDNEITITKKIYRGRLLGWKDVEQIRYATDGSVEVRRRSVRLRKRSRWYDWHCFSNCGDESRVSGNYQDTSLTQQLSTEVPRRLVRDSWRVLGE